MHIILSIINDNATKMYISCTPNDALKEIIKNQRKVNKKSNKKGG